MALVEGGGGGGGVVRRGDPHTHTTRRPLDLDRASIRDQPRSIRGILVRSDDVQRASRLADASRRRSTRDRSFASESSSSLQDDEVLLRPYAREHAITTKRTRQYATESSFRDEVVCTRHASPNSPNLEARTRVVARCAVDQRRQRVGVDRAHVQRARGHTVRPVGHLATTTMRMKRQ